MKKLKVLIIYVEIVIIVLIQLPFLMAATYANICADDIRFLQSFLNSGISNTLYYAFYNTKELGLHWQGTYFTNFFVTFALERYYRSGSLIIHLEYLVVILLWITVIFSFIYSLISKISVDKLLVFDFSLAITIMAQIMILHNASSIYEAFYWHNAIYADTLPFLLGLFALSLMLRNSRRHYILASILSFLCAGGSLNIAAFICCALLFLTFYLFYKHEQYRYSVVAFGIAVIGAVINAGSPGNFVRLQQTDTKFNLIETILIALLGVGKRNISILTSAMSPFFYILGIIITVALWRFVRKCASYIISPLVLIGMTLCLEFIVDFPVVIAYGKLGIPARCEFISSTIAVILLIIIYIDSLLYLVKKLNMKFELSGIEASLLVSILCVALFVPCLTEPIQSSYFPFIIYNDLKSGKLQKYEETVNLILNRVEIAEPESDVFIELYEDNSISYIKDLGLTSNEEDSVNKAYADCYNLNSIKVVYAH